MRSARGSSSFPCEQAPHPSGGAIATGTPLPAGQGRVSVNSTLHSRHKLPLIKWSLGQYSHCTALAQTGRLYDYGHLAQQVHSMGGEHRTASMKSSGTPCPLFCPEEASSLSSLFCGAPERDCTATNAIWMACTSNGKLANPLQLY